MKRPKRVRRKTPETDIKAELVLYGKGKHRIKTGIAFLDHMLSLFAKHGLFDLALKAEGDLEVDFHHTNEDVAIVLGEAFSNLLGDRRGIKRFGEATVPMDEALVRVIIDISGRPFLKLGPDPIKQYTDYYKQKTTGKQKTIGSTLYDLNYAEQFFRAFVINTGITMHVDILAGRDLHHILEAAFKAFAKALMKAIEKEPRSKSIPSTKGRI